MLTIAGYVAIVEGYRYHLNVRALTINIYAVRGSENSVKSGCAAIQSHTLHSMLSPTSCYSTFHTFELDRVHFRKTYVSGLGEHCEI